MATKLSAEGINKDTIAEKLLSEAAGAVPPIYFKVNVPNGGKFGRVLDRVLKLLGSTAQEWIGEIGAGLLAHSLGFEDANLPEFPSVPGPDLFMRQPNLPVWAMIEAKGGRSPLGKDASYGRQMHHQWITYWYSWLADKNHDRQGTDGPDLWDHWGKVSHKSTPYSERQLRKAKPIVASVVKLNMYLKRNQLKVGIQAWTKDPDEFNKWKGFG